MRPILLFLVLICLFTTACNPYLKYKQANPTPINAKRIMFLVMPQEEVGVPLGSFFMVCDSVFRKNNIAKMAFPLLPEYFDGTKHVADPIAKPIREFQPDCLIILFPEKIESNTRSTFV